MDSELSSITIRVRCFRCGKEITSYPYLLCEHDGDIVLRGGFCYDCVDELTEDAENRGRKQTQEQSSVSQVPSVPTYETLEMFLIEHLDRIVNDTIALLHQLCQDYYDGNLASYTIRQLRDIVADSASRNEDPDEIVGLWEPKWLQYAIVILEQIAESRDLLSVEPARTDFVAVRDYIMYNILEKLHQILNELNDYYLVCWERSPEKSLIFWIAEVENQARSAKEILEKALERVPEENRSTYIDGYIDGARYLYLTYCKAQLRACCKSVAKRIRKDLGEE